MKSKEEGIKELSEKFRHNLSKIPSETRRMMAVKVEKIVREEIDIPRGKVNDRDHHSTKPIA